MNDGQPKSSIATIFHCGASKSINMNFKIVDMVFVVLFIYSLPLPCTIKLESRLQVFCKHIRLGSEVSKAITPYMKACCETYHSETYSIGNINGFVCI